MDIDILLQRLAKPAQRAIQNEGITTRLFIFGRDLSI
jgi:hypothetical protein